MEDLIISAEAFDTKTNKIVFPVSPENIEFLKSRGYTDFLCPEHSPCENRYQCLSCKEYVIAVRPNDFRWHFRHHPESKCSSPREFKLNESGQHKLAKSYLSYFLLNKIPIVISGANCITSICTNKKEDIAISYTDKDSVFTEYNIGNNKRCDVALVQNECTYIFEILCTNRQYERPEPWFEIEATEIIDNHETLPQKIILKDVKKYCCGSCPQVINYKNIIQELPSCSNPLDTDIIQKSKENIVINTLFESNLDVIDIKDDEINKRILAAYGVKNFVTGVEGDIKCCPSCNNFEPTWILNIGNGVCTACDAARGGKGSGCYRESCGNRIYFNTKTKPEGCKWDKRIKKYYTCVHNVFYKEYIRKYGNYSKNILDFLFNKEVDSLILTPGLYNEDYNDIDGNTGKCVRCYDEDYIGNFLANGQVCNNCFLKLKNNKISLKRTKSCHINSKYCCEEIVYLSVNFEEKEYVKRLGCMYHPEEKKWYTCFCHKNIIECLLKW